MSFFRVRKVTIILLLCLIVMSCFARPIGLKKKRRYKGRAMPFIPVIADISDDHTGTLTIQFLKQMNNVLVEVTDKNGNIIYSDIVDASTTENYTISLANEEAGIYELAIIPVSDLEYAGTFELY